MVTYTNHQKASQMKSDNNMRLQPYFQTTKPLLSYFQVKHLTLTEGTETD